MAKSLLSTEEMRKLKDCGVSKIGIAELAGVSVQAVHYRLAPGRNREPSKRVYQNLDGAGKREYLATGMRRYQALQERSIAAGISRPAGGKRWTEEEIQYLKAHATTKTTLEIALHLKRTYKSAQRAAARYHIKLNEE